jgi:alpha-tubulin suppressor-like RCC1 family protein
MVTVPGVLKAMSAGYGHTCAFASDFGEYRCWGRNYYGEIGDGTKTNRSSPTPNLKFSGSAAEASVAPGYYHTCAIGHDALKVKRVFCWGTDNVGSLGNGSAAIKLRPTQVTGV